MCVALKALSVPLEVNTLITTNDRQIIAEIKVCNIYTMRERDVSADADLYVNHNDFVIKIYSISHGYDLFCEILINY